MQVTLGLRLADEAGDETDPGARVVAHHVTDGIHAGQVAGEPRHTESAGVAMNFRRGADLVLVARSEGKLAALAEELSGSYGVTADVVAADLAKPSAAGELAASLRARDLQIDILIK